MPDSSSAAWPWFRARLAALRPAMRPLPPDGQPGAVVRTAVVTDSAAALPADWVAALTVVPMPVMVGEEIYGEGEDDILETIALALATGKSVKTSRPSPGQFEQAYRAALQRGYEAVVSVHISGGLSGTADAARLAAARAVARLEEIVAADAAARPGESVRLAVHHFGNPQEAESLAVRLNAALPQCPPAQISSLPAVLAAHAGLGVLAVIVGQDRPVGGPAMPFPHSGFLACRRLSGCP